MVTKYPYLSIALKHLRKLCGWLICVIALRLINTSELSKPMDIRMIWHMDYKALSKN